MSTQLPPYPTNCRPVHPTDALSDQLPPYPPNRRPILPTASLSVGCVEGTPPPSTSLCIYTYIHNTYACTYVCIYIHIYIYIYTNACMYIGGGGSACGAHAEADGRLAVLLHILRHPLPYPPTNRSPIHPPTDALSCQLPSYPLSVWQDRASVWRIGRRLGG